VSVALGGNLRDFGIAEVFQLIGQQSKTGVLEIGQGGRKLRLAFDEGAVVWASPVGSTEHAALGENLVRAGLITRETLMELLAESENSARSLPSLLAVESAVSDRELAEVADLLTRETIFEVLKWAEGSFHFKAQPVLHDRPKEELLGAEQILMDGLRMLDEWRTFQEDVPSDDVVFQRTGRFEVYRQKAAGDARGRLEAAQRVFQLVDGRLTARRVMDLARLGSFDGVRILSDLRRAGLIEVLESKRVRPRVPSAAPGNRVGESLRWTLSAVIPIAILGALVVALGLRSGPRLPPDEFPIARRPLEDARASFERRRLRHEVELARLQGGEWPASLASPGDASYYYAVREGQMVLLTPKRSGDVPADASSAGSAP